MIKKKLMLVGILLLATTANAEEYARNEGCANISKMAELTMALRQHEAPISVALETSKTFAKDGTTSGAELAVFMDNLTMEAYSQDLRYSERMKQISINEFATKYYLDCMRSTD